MSRFLLVMLTVGFALQAATATPQKLELLLRQGPWHGVSGLIGYGDRLWFANSVKFVNHNSADIYSYDPRTGKSRYERHLFSQDAGDPVVAGGLLYWPFEDGRFSVGRGEFAVTNGSDWTWSTLPAGEAFHLHSMAARGGKLYAAIAAWRAGLLSSDDNGATWRVIHDHPTPEGRVSRLTSLAFLDATLYAGLTSRTQPGAKLMKLTDDVLMAVQGWPEGRAIAALEAHRGWLYAANQNGRERSVWRTDGKRVERLTALDNVNIRAFASGPDSLWAVSAGQGNGRLWRTEDGSTWQAFQRFENAEPLDVAVYAGMPYVGTRGPGEQGGLWGAAVPVAEAPIRHTPVPDYARRAHRSTQTLLDEIDRIMASADNYSGLREGMHSTLRPLAVTGLPAVGMALSERLEQPQPERQIPRFGGAYTSPLGELNRWLLLWALALNGQGRVPPDMLAQPWDKAENPAQKYFHAAPAAMWVAAVAGQNDHATLDALVQRLDQPGQPLWLTGDVIGVLSAVTGQRFGYDVSAWRQWWNDNAAAYADDMIRIPAGTLAMGSTGGEPAEAPVHEVSVSGFLLDRYEVTNREFAEFVTATGHVTDRERAGWGWHWVGKWRRVEGADWRHPAGSGSSIEGLDDHPVVQVSWHDAQAWCEWRGKRLPTEAEWERAARGVGYREYAWGATPPRIADVYLASYGADPCCRADDGDGYLMTAPTGSFPAGRSPFGVQDMTGNVWEWVRDSYDPEYYLNSPTADPLNEDVSLYKVIRGGGWGNNPLGLRATLRHSNRPASGLSMVGFRCAK